MLLAAGVEGPMTIPVDREHIAAVLRLHGVSLREPELEAVRAQVTANVELMRALIEDPQEIPAETLPALQPAWLPGAGQAESRGTVAQEDGGPDGGPGAGVQPGAAGAGGSRARGGSTAGGGDAAPGPAAAAARSAPAPLPRRYETPLEAVEAALAQIEAHAEANVFIAVFADRARDEAKELMRRAGRGAGAGTAGAFGPAEVPLWGTTVSIKDLMHIRGYAMTGGTRALAWPVADRDAPIVERLRRAGAVVIGAVNLHELAFGTTGENPHFGTVANPAAPGRLSGGSSSGSAASVGFGMATFSIGTDTGGSIRIPAACCGVVGFKPSFGLLPNDGVFPLGFSLDHVGPLTKTVTEAAVLMDVLADRPGGFTAGLDAPLKGLRIGVPRNYFTLAQAAVREAYEQALERAQAAGARLVPVSLPYIERAPAAYLGTSGVEAIGIHYHTLVRHGHRLGADVRVRLASNLFTPAYVRIKAQQLRTLMFRELEEIFRSVDVLATPTLPIAPPPVGTRTVQVQDVSMATTFAFLRYTSPFNLTGLPAISLPNGRDQDGAPVGLQLVGPYGADARVLQAARALEREGLGG